MDCLFLAVNPVRCLLLISLAMAYDEYLWATLWKRKIGFIESVLDLVRKTGLLNNDFFGIDLHHGGGHIIRLSICLILCFIATVVIAVLAKDILNKKERAFLFLPYILTMVLILVCLTDIFKYMISITYIVYGLCVLMVNIYIPIKLKKLQKG